MSSKLSLPAFLSVLVGTGITMKDAMSVAPGLIKAGFNSSASSNPFVGATDATLVAAGVANADIRKVLVNYGKGKKKPKAKANIITDLGSSHKRKRDSDLESPLPSAPPPTAHVPLEFSEVYVEEELMDAVVVVNRAPVSTAWAFVVSEKLGFKREEALSLAQVYTELNATSKGVSIGVMSPTAKLREKQVGSSQPFVELLGRKIPVMSVQDNQWRGVVGGAMADPEKAFGYIQRAFKDKLGHVIGAMRLLVDSFELAKINEIGYSLYCDFRPEGTGWGQKTELRMAKILELRPKAKTQQEPAEGESSSKKPKVETKAEEDFEFDDWDDVDLDQIKY